MQNNPYSLTKCFSTCVLIWRNTYSMVKIHFPMCKISKMYLWSSLCQKVIRRCIPGVPGWLSWLSVTFSSGHDLKVHGFKPYIWLCVDSSEPRTCVRFCVSVTLCPFPAHALSLSVSLLKINKNIKKNLKIKKMHSNRTWEWVKNTEITRGSKHESEHWCSQMTFPGWLGKGHWKSFVSLQGE